MASLVTVVTLIVSVHLAAGRKCAPCDHSGSKCGEYLRSAQLEMRLRCSSYAPPAGVVQRDRSLP